MENGAKSSEPNGVTTDNKQNDDISKPGDHLPSVKLPVPVFVWRISLVLSVFLYSSFTIFVHLCEVDGKLPFRTTAVVFLVEVLKLILSTLMYAHTHHVFNGERGLIHTAKLELRQNYQLSTDRSTLAPNPPPLTWWQCGVVVLPFTVPAVLYAVNNNLAMYIQLEMDPATYQVLGNFKILSTAILFRLIIKRPITPLQWFALFLLLSAGLTHSYGSLLARSMSSDVASAASLHNMHISTLGIAMIALYCTVSGLSGVYTEYVMKKRAKMSIHLQNGLLYVFGVIINGILFVVEANRSHGDASSWNLFTGFTVWTWLLVITQAVVGIFIGFVMKYSDNITRLFIISSAMLVTTVAAMGIFGLHLNVLFVISFVLVCASLYLYHK